MRLLAVHSNVLRSSQKRSLKESLATKIGKYFLKVLVWSIPLVACIHEELVENSIEVIPQVYEGRQDEPEKMLIVEHGHSLNLRKASVLAKNLLLRDITEEGVHDKYVDGALYEANLYEDTSKQASLLIEPLPGGDYHIVGLLNYTHRIEPLAPMDRSGRTVHRVSQLASNNGTCDAIGVVGGRLYEEAYSGTEARTLSKGFAIELYLMTDYVHTRPFGKRDKQRVRYAAALMHSVSLRMQQLDPPGSIIITAIQASFTMREPYVQLLAKDLIGSNTSKLLQQHIQSSQAMLQSDIVFMLTGRDMISVVNGNKSSSLAGLAYTGYACKSHKVGLAEDKPEMFSGVQYVAHEIGHLLNGSACLKTNTNPEVVVLPSKNTKLPGELLNGAEFCKKYFSTYKNVAYVKLDSDLRRCRLRCQLGPRIQTFKDALDGTPCDSTRPEMKCKEGVCKQW
ncbi:venom metalloproteinase 2-like isoform X2 [Dermacentor variabilis]|uniref:venom metalloproteinase 2-like isoform X2 n=1 Tax=Dermacentor variabilis TaxID=34621 RepID=UPI003F5B0521